MEKHPPSLSRPHNSPIIFFTCSKILQNMTHLALTGHWSVEKKGRIWDAKGCFGGI